MKKKDLLLSDFENQKVRALASFKGGGWIKKFSHYTDDACTSGDVGCCDVDEIYNLVHEETGTIIPAQ